TRLVSDWSSDVCSSDLSAVVRGSKLKFWKTKPIFLLRITARPSDDRLDTSVPSSQYSPEDGRSRQPSRFISVVLPEPDAPVSARSEERRVGKERGGRRA